MSITQATTEASSNSTVKSIRLFHPTLQKHFVSRSGGKRPDQTSKKEERRESHDPPLDNAQSRRTGEQELTPRSKG